MCHRWYVMMPHMCVLSLSSTRTTALQLSPCALRLLRCQYRRNQARRVAADILTQEHGVPLLLNPYTYGGQTTLSAVHVPVPTCMSADASVIVYSRSACWFSSGGKPAECNQQYTRLPSQRWPRLPVEQSEAARTMSLMPAQLQSATEHAPQTG